MYQRSINEHRRECVDRLLYGQKSYNNIFRDGITFYRRRWKMSETQWMVIEYSPRENFILKKRTVRTFEKKLDEFLGAVKDWIFWLVRCVCASSCSGICFAHRILNLVENMLNVVEGTTEGEDRKDFVITIIYSFILDCLRNIADDNNQSFNQWTVVLRHLMAHDQTTRKIEIIIFEENFPS